MSVEILQDGDQRLRDTAQPLPAELFNTAELDKMVADMAEALDGQADGVAIAAPQIGLPWRIFLVRYDRVKPPAEGEPEREAEIGVYINPSFVRTSKKRADMDEGCLSVRGKYGKVKRAERATVRAFDQHGAEFERGGGGLLAQIFQHEVDHLDGILFIDKATEIRSSRRRKDKFAFFGTPYVARDTLATLVKAGYTPTVVVTSPDRPKGRGLELLPCETKAWALEAGIPVLSPETLDEAATAEIAEFGCSYAIVVAYGKILPTPLIDSFPKGMLNVHYSLLPKYRGASPVEGALLNGDTVTGVAIQKLVPELDAGDILAMHEEEILPDDTTKTLRARLIELGADLLIDSLPEFIRGDASFTPQDHTAATRTRKIKKEAGELSLANQTADESRENWNKYRAYAESPGTYFFAERSGKTFRTKIKEAEFVGGEFRPVRVTPEGKSELSYADFLAAGYLPR
jgi:methionyl-tRNA formyltransferase